MQTKKTFPRRKVYSSLASDYLKEAYPWSAMTTLPLIAPASSSDTRYTVFAKDSGFVSSPPMTFARMLSIRPLLVALDNRRVYRAPRDRDDADAVRRELERGRLRHQDDGSFGRMIRERPRRSQESEHVVKEGLISLSFLHAIRGVQYKP